MKVLPGVRPGPLEMGRCHEANVRSHHMPTTSNGGGHADRDLIEEGNPDASLARAFDDNQIREGNGEDESGGHEETIGYRRTCGRLIRLRTPGPTTLREAFEGADPVS